MDKELWASLNAAVRELRAKNTALQARLDAVIALCDKWDPKDMRGIFNRIPVHDVRAAATGVDNA